MKISVFTSNQPRHLSLVRMLAEIAETVYAVLECNTVFPGRVADFFRKSEVMQDYFSCVMSAEKEVFGAVGFLPANVSALPLKMMDLAHLDSRVLEEALDADVFVVFGASFIRPPLVDRLIERRAINIHMGISPYYRGSSCNFWAMYDRRPEMVGATIHLLSRGLDSGGMLFHALPSADRVDPFVYGMRSVRAAHRALVERVASNAIMAMTPVPQDRTQEIRYTRNQDFTDTVAAEYLARVPSPDALYESLRQRDLSRYLNPVVF